MIGILLAIFALSGGIGTIAMADASQKPLGIIPIVVFVAGYTTPMWFPSRDIGTIYLVAIALEVGAAVGGMMLFQRARTQKMNRAIAED